VFCHTHGFGPPRNGKVDSACPGLAHLVSGVSPLTRDELPAPEKLATGDKLSTHYAKGTQSISTTARKLQNFRIYFSPLLQGSFHLFPHGTFRYRGSTLSLTWKAVLPFSTGKAYTPIYSTRSLRRVLPTEFHRRLFIPKKVALLKNLNHDLFRSPLLQTSRLISFSHPT